MNRPFTIDDECDIEEESIFLPPRFDEAEGEGCEFQESTDSKLLYEGATITVGISILLILTVTICHSLTGEALNDILCLINLHCLSPNLCPKSLFRLKRHFRDTFTYNTDGVPLFKSSKFSLWPLYFAINELPCQQCFQKENMILAGLWYGKSKPIMLNFLKPFHTALSKLETDGIEAKSPSGENLILKAILLLGTCNMPAKCMVCNSTQ